jgi:MFS family permease
MYTIVQTIDIPILRYVPELLAWIVGIVLAIIIVRRGGRKAEKLLLAGCVLMLFSPLSVLFLRAWFVPALQENDIGSLEIMRSPAWIVLNIMVGLCSLAGLVCLVWAFLLKFRNKKQEVAR